MKKTNSIIKERIRDSIIIKQKLLEDTEVLGTISDLADEIVNTIKKGNKIVICGNGGSASDALHLAGEIVGRFQKERAPWPAIVLNADVATMTAIANDYGYDEVYARQAEGQVNAGDIFIGISTSGNSENVSRAADAAYRKGAKTAALLGNDGGKLKKKVDYPVVVPSMTTARIQESHIMIIHILCEIIEMKMS